MLLAVLEVEGGYRYIAIFSKYEPVGDIGNGNILTSVNAVYGALGLKFWPGAGADSSHTIFFTPRSINNFASRGR